MQANAQKSVGPDEEADFLAQIWNVEIREAFESSSALIKAACPFFAKRRREWDNPFHRLKRMFSLP